MLDLRTPFACHVLEAGRADDGEADEEDIRLRVGERTEPVVILLTGRVPQAQADRHAVADHWRGIVVKNCSRKKLSRLFFLLLLRGRIFGMF